MSTVQQYLKKIEQQLVLGSATEHTHRPTLKELLEGCSPGVVAINEPKRIACGAPDLVVLKNDLTVGYLEAKDVGKPLDEIARSEQLKRYREALGNLILTDYLRFIWYVDGEERQRVTVATQGQGGRLKISQNGITELGILLDEFLAQKPQDITSPSVLAERMAKLTHLIRDIVIQAFQRNEASQLLTDLRLAMAQTLLPDH
ncbi:MAG: hypothetical protein GX579_10175 [Chloroflexi bacterium]|jgi:hypothetical protein|nr:hypothetical protein [Chloroflexota bacterium]